MFSSIYWHVFILFINCSLFFKSENVYLKGLTLTIVIVMSMLIFKKMIPEINIHIHKDK